MNFDNEKYSDRSFRDINLRHGIYHLCLYFNFSFLSIYNSLISPRLSDIKNTTPNLGLVLTKLGNKMETGTCTKKKKMHL